MAVQTHQSAPGVLDRRTLRQDHRRLAEVLRPGLRVLDVGCGTGAITRGIAEAVAPGGFVVGIDRDPGHVERASAAAAGSTALRFEIGDATGLAYEAEFDVVTAARTLQWIADPPAALRRMAHATRSGGWLVLLDYDHACNTWDPAPPAAFAAFYAAFLSWRAANGWDNEMASHLPARLDEVGVSGAVSEAADEISEPGDADFAARTSLWVEVIDHLGPTLSAAGVCDERLCAEARATYEAWRTSTLQRQTLSMRTVVARVAREG